MERLISYNKKIETKYKLFILNSSSNNINNNIAKNHYGDQLNSWENNLEVLLFFPICWGRWKIILLSFLLLFKLQNSLFEHLEGFTYLISAILASILLALSIYAYKKKYVKKILYAVFAFVFFAGYLFFEAFENFYPFLETATGIDLMAAS